MKNCLLVLTVFFGMNVFAQTEKEIKKVSASTCACLDEKTLNLDDAEDFELTIGTCILAAMLENGIKIDMENPDQMEKFGERIGLVLMVTCPKFNALIGEVEEVDPEGLSDLIGDENDSYYEISSGEFLEVVSGDFVSIKIKNDSGKKETFYWFEYFEGSNLLENNGVEIEGKSISVEYETIEVYSPKIEDYTELNVIRLLEIID